MKNIDVASLSYRPNKYTDEVLKQITMNLNKGEFYGILGPNGSGKTTLIRHLLGLIKIQHGKITFEDKNLIEYHKKELAMNVAFVPQNTYLEADFSVYDIIAMGRTPYKKRFAELKDSEIELISEAMEITNTKKLKNKRFNELSGGEAQRVLVARAIVQDTPWLVLDEPISHLDIKHQVELMETLKWLNQEKHKSIVAILHDLNLTSAYCNQVILMKNGQIYAAGSVDEVLTKENLKEVYELDFDIKRVSKNGHKYFLPLRVIKEDE